MTKEQRIRRAILLCIHFTRNLAFTRAITKNVTHKNEGDFWITLDGNCLDVAVLEWCKLFGEPKGKHSWEKIIDSKDGFRSKLKTSLGIDDEAWDRQVNELRSYRDSFIAHLDNNKTMNIPKMELPKNMLFFLHSELKELIDSRVHLQGYDFPLEEYYENMFKYAEKHLSTCDIELA